MTCNIFICIIYITCAFEHITRGVGLLYDPN